MAESDGPVAALKQGLASLLETGELADFTIVCGPHTFKVHKAILRAHSEYFGALSNFAEGEKNSIELKAIGSGDGDDDACDDPDAIKLMTDYFYHLDYFAPFMLSPSETEPATPAETGDQTHPERRSYNSVPPPPLYLCNRIGPTDGNMVTHAKVYAAAVKYHVPALATLAAAKFQKAVDVNWDHNSFAVAVHLAYTTTPKESRDLRETVASAITRHDNLLYKPEVEATVCGITRLAYELLKKSRGASGTTGDVCGRCDTKFGPKKPHGPLAKMCECGIMYRACECVIRCPLGRTVRGCVV
ncbi:hypothetical protein B0A50_06239 [Salinomyces thailandicus]|uniref:BTB domain-containing protein n=1 Tax=Salinomyces thailandicus TaxID=706561 RepID=A0A4U0TU46_9PEZI|nr:hypothetical protein B0A50_06239 [Salinomyces thailandica]